MYAVRIISLCNGWRILTEDKAEEWQNIKDALSEVKIESVKDERWSPAYRLEGPSRMTDLTRMWDYKIAEQGWKVVRKKAHNVKARSFALKNTKNKVAARMLASEVISSQSLYQSLFIDAPQSQRLQLCDVFVILIAVDKISDSFSERERTSLSLFESECRAQLAELSPIPISSPFVVVFFSENFENISIEELLTVDSSAIERSIEFEPEYYQAGVDILSYFGKVLRQKHPDMNAKVRIEQEGNKVRMHIETSPGNRETVERELEKYALVVQAEATPEDLFSNPADVMALKHKFDVAQMEIRHTRDLLQFTSTGYEKRIKTLEEDVAFMRQSTGAQLLHANAVVDLAVKQAASYERLHMAQIALSNNLFKDLITESKDNEQVLQAIHSLGSSVMTGIATVEIEERIEAALVTLKQEKPTLLARIAEQIESAGYGAAASFALEWINQHI